MSTDGAQPRKYKYLAKNSEKGRGYKYKFENPVEGNYRGVSVRRYNVIKINVSSFEFKKFIDAKLDHNLSAKDAIQQRKALCSLCEPDPKSKFI